MFDRRNLSGRLCVFAAIWFVLGATQAIADVQNLYTVEGVPVDERAADELTAKSQGIEKAQQEALQGLIEKIILTRPAVEAGERLGFLPGDMKEKIDPYLRPIYDALYEMMPADRVDKKIRSGEIEIAPLAFMRGRTFTNSFVIVDEAQNTTSIQMKMVLTRIGQGSRMVINGDLSQVDLPTGQISGLNESKKILSKIKDIGIILLEANDVIRHPIVAKIIKAYDNFTKN